MVSAHQAQGYFPYSYFSHLSDLFLLTLIYAHMMCTIHHVRVCRQRQMDKVSS